MLLTISESWQAMLFIEKIYWCIAIPFSLLFVIQMVMTFFGGDVDSISASGDADLAVDSDDGIEFQFISIKNLIVFFTIFGWVGIMCIHSDIGQWLTLLLSTLAGLAMMTVMSAILYFMGKLTESGTLNIKHAVGKTATVYLTIPPKRGGMGQIQVNHQGLRTLDALTDNDEPIVTGAMVEIIGILSNEILIVKRSNS